MKKNIGSSFDSWLQEEGIREQVTAAAIRRVLVRQMEAAPRESEQGGAAPRSDQSEKPAEAG